MKSALLAITLSLLAAAARAEEKTPEIAVITTAYYQNSHADVLATRLLKGYTLDGQGEFPKLKFASLYTDQVPANDISRKLATEFKFPIYENVADALTL